MLNTKKLFTKLTPKIKTMTGTTDSNGNLSLGLSDSAAKSIIGITGSNFVYIPFVGLGILDSELELNYLSERENHSGHVPSESFVVLGSQLNGTCRNSHKSVCSGYLGLCRFFGVLRHYWRRWESLDYSNQGSICRSADKRRVYYDDEVTIKATISERGWYCA